LREGGVNRLDDVRRHPLDGVLRDSHLHLDDFVGRQVVTAFLKRTPDKVYTPIKTGRKKYKNSRLTNAILLVFIVF
uniref:hypothetical protein n=1 Tax=Ruminococcus sp. TaxID=41978 RepID=UPI003AB6C36C